ncbi:hypothetical protein RFI_09728 [Reticulomyxa filosa]|uniref:K Homology domain-containing protein n=1 Tax=Reticulomyxa filosa TaxID=46433 RepID=X6NPY5_RETFI|nr:hypothetical protein RFI_09728 [Reticulomyxa filosa]|eukprot:ETO27402.1 hypothetical protein RFI_09728 [Reticulomyxa filosa]
MITSNAIDNSNSEQTTNADKQVREEKTNKKLTNEDSNKIEDKPTNKGTCVAGNNNLNNIDHKFRNTAKFSPIPCLFFFCLKKKKKKAKGVGLVPTVNTNAHVYTLRLLLDARKVGSLIGKGGATINSIRNRSDTKIFIAVKYTSSCGVNGKVYVWYGVTMHGKQKPVASALYRIGSVEGSVGPIICALQMICDAQSRESINASWDMGNAKKQSEDEITKDANDDSHNEYGNDNEHENENPSVNKNVSGLSASYGITLLVEEKNIGRLIGKGGEAISYIRKITKADIYISSQLLRYSTEKTVDIYGTKTATHAAIQHIVQRLLESNAFMPPRVPYDPSCDVLQLYDKRKNKQWLSPERKPKQSSFRFQKKKFCSFDFKTIPKKVHLRGRDGPASNQSFYRPRYAGAQAQPGTDAQLLRINAPSIGYTNYHYPNHSIQNALSYVPLKKKVKKAFFLCTHVYTNYITGKGYQQYKNDDSAENESTPVVIPVSTKLIGSVIGRQGRNIQEIRLKSQASIQIDNVPTKNERHITVSGTPRQVETAISLIEESIKRETSRQ